jgi:predicted permease
MRPDAPNVILLADQLWRETFGSRPDVVGQRVTINGATHTVIGVLPAQVRYPAGEVGGWLPLRPATSAATGRPPRVRLIARLAPGVTRPAAEQRVADVGKQIVSSGVATEGLMLRGVNDSHLNPDTRRGLLILAAASLCVLLIACVNAASLLLVRTTERAREVSIRAALGAGRSDILRLFLLESVVVATLGGVAGVLLAFWGVDALVAAMPRDVTVFGRNVVSVDGRVLAFALVISTITGLGFGIGPALRATRYGARLNLSQRNSTASRTERASRGLLVIAEVAFCTVLLIGAGLFIGSLTRLARIDPGFRADHVLSMNFRPARSRYPTAEARAALYSQVEAKLRALPGVRAVSMSSALPPNAGATFPEGMQAEGGPTISSSSVGVIPMLVVDSAFFSVLRIPLVAGRAFEPTDVKGGEEVAIVDRDLAALLWPSEGNVVGRRFRLDADGTWLRVVAIAENANLVGRTASYGRYGVYRPMGQEPAWTSSLAIAIETAGDPAAIAPAVRSAFRSIDGQQPIDAMATLEERLSATLAQPRFLVFLMGTFGAIALILAMLGIYGMLASAVAQQRREIGIRMALGAAALNIGGAVVARGLTLTLTGIAIGIVTIVGVRRAIAASLYGFSATDPMTIGTVALLFLATAVVAMLVPARRASRVDPAIAMAAE